MYYKILLTVILILGAILIYNYKFKPPETIISSVPALAETDTSGIYVHSPTSTAYIQEKQPDGTVQTHTTFIPAESNYTIVTSTQTGKTEINIKSKGFCFAPNVSATYTDNIVIGLGARLAYWNQWGVGASINSDLSLGAFIDYRLYAFKLKNISLFLSFVPVNNKGTSIRSGLTLYLN